MKVSVIIPTYNRCDSLKKAINSVLSQTYENIEIIVVDDNNTDSESRRLVENIMFEYENNKKVIYLKHIKNLNGAVARNTGIRKSSGELICFLDDDDYFLPKKIAKQVSFLFSNNRFKGVYCGSNIKGINRTSPLEGNLSRELLLKETILFTPSLMFYAKTIKELNGFDESYKRHQDYEFLLRFFMKYEIGSIQEVLLVVGDNDGDNRLTGIDFEVQKNEFLNQFSTVIEKINLKDASFKKRVYSKHYVEILFSHLKNKNIFLAKQIFKKCLFNSPLLFAKYFIARLWNYILYKRNILLNGVN